MLSTLEAFEKFRKKLELGDTESKDASRRQTDVRECVRSGFDVKTDFLSGSYRRHTKTKPLKDVDVMFVLGDNEKWRREKPPIEMLQAFEKCLKKTFGADQTELCRRAVTVTFEKDYYPDDHEGKVLSIDAVPAFEAGKDVYEIPDKVTGKWIKTNPKKHMEQATEKNDELDGSTDVGFRSSKWPRAGTGRMANRSSHPSWWRSWQKGSWRRRFQPTRTRCGTCSPRWRQMLVRPGQTRRALALRSLIK
jgi:Second Messenger Oligonucleotide or Dinucleotide Synthetase domain